MDSSSLRLPAKKEIPRRAMPGDSAIAEEEAVLGRSESSRDRDFALDGTGAEAGSTKAVSFNEGMFGDKGIEGEEEMDGDVPP